MSALPHRPADVDLDVLLRLVVPEGGAVPLPVALRYSGRDPYAVRAIFRGGDTEVEWVFARELLADGLRWDTGEGDVRVRPATTERGPGVIISLSSPDGQAVLEAEAVDVQCFLARTAEVVPPGKEHLHLDLDSVISRLLV